MGREVARQEGITLDEAISRYAWHEPFSLVVNDIRQRYPADFAGARIEGHTKADAWVAFSGRVPAGAARAVAEFSGAVAIEENRGFTEAQIAQQHVDTHYAVWNRKDLVSELSSGYDVETGLITLEAQGRGLSTAAQKSDLERRLADVAARVPARARTIAFDVVVVDAVRGGDDTVYGGVRLSTCTTGYTVVTGSGQRGVSTAGHCGNDQTYDGRLNLNYQAGHENTWGDLQWHTSSEYEEDDFYYNHGVRRDVTGRNFANEGQRICKFGKTTGATCDDVYQLNHCWGDRCHLTAMHNRLADGGDSGGPWYYGNTAYGGHSGYKWWNFKNRDLFMPSRYFNDALGIEIAIS